MDEDRPVLVGAAQLLQRDADPREALEPLAMLERVARGACEDAAVGKRALRELDTVGVVQVAGWRALSPPRLLAEALGAKPTREVVTATGGEIPLTLVNDIAERIAAGQARVALIAGCNNLRTLRHAGKAKIRLDWIVGEGPESTLFGENKRGSSEREADYGLRLPPEIYPIFENALRARRGLDLETHRRRVGELMSRFTRVAAENPYAWFPVARSADQITTATPDNRMIAFPYTKYMNAVMETDQAAAVLTMSAGAARALGVPEDRWVHWWGGAQAQEEAWYPSERPDFARCPSLGDTVRGALTQAGLSLEELDRIDLYSCFAVAVEMACEMLGIDEADPRGLTVTGGLPYAGGPGSNYTLHSLATMMAKLREQPGSRGLLTGNGWYLTKHSACVVASAPRAATTSETASPLAPEPEPRRQAAPAEPLTGRGTVEAYTVLFDREGAPSRGIVLGRSQDGRRFLANTPDDRELLEAFAAVEDVGRSGALRSEGGHQLFVPA